MEGPVFEEFPKIARLSREIVITEKIDGTNAQIFIGEAGEFLAGSRTRWLSTAKGADNFGFATWAEQHRDELLKLGPGRHYGEWWGQGIQRGYGLTCKRFSLFNVSQWAEDATRPECCLAVPVLYRGPFSEAAIGDALRNLETAGSVAAPGFMKPEGVVIWHSASRQLFKKTLEKDEVPKSLAA